MADPENADFHLLKMKDEIFIQSQETVENKIYKYLYGLVEKTNKSKTKHNIMPKGEVKKIKACMPNGVNLFTNIIMSISQIKDTIDRVSPDVIKSYEDSFLYFNMIQSHKRHTNMIQKNQCSAALCNFLEIYRTSPENEEFGGNMIDYNKNNLWIIRCMANQLTSSPNNNIEYIKQHGDDADILNVYTEISGLNDDFKTLDENDKAMFYLIKAITIDYLIIPHLINSMTCFAYMKYNQNDIHIIDRLILEQGAMTFKEFLDWEPPITFSAENCNDYSTKLLELHELCINMLETHRHYTCTNIVAFISILHNTCSSAGTRVFAEVLNKFLSLIKYMFEEYGYLMLIKCYDNLYNTSFIKLYTQERYMEIFNTIKYIIEFWKDAQASDMIDLGRSVFRRPYMPVQSPEIINLRRLGFQDISQLHIGAI